VGQVRWNGYRKHTISATLSSIHQNLLKLVQICQSVNRNKNVVFWDTVYVYGPAAAAALQRRFINRRRWLLLLCVKTLYNTASTLDFNTVSIKEIVTQGGQGHAPRHSDSDHAECSKWRPLAFTQACSHVCHWWMALLMTAWIIRYQVSTSLYFSSSV